VRGGQIGSSLVPQDAVFADGIVGIAGPAEDTPLLAAVAALSASDVARYWHFMTSSMWGVERDAIAKGEFLALPVPRLTAEASLELCELTTATGPWEKILRGANSRIYDLYNLSLDERERITNFVNVDLPRYIQPARGYSSPADDDWITNYCSTICDALEASLDSLNFDAVFRRDLSYCTVALTISQAGGPAHDREGLIGRVSIDPDRIIDVHRRSRDYGTSVYAQPAGLFLDDTNIYIVKTTDRDRWSRDSALGDAERIFTALAFRSL
jgi:hypothetical protein